jgi:hypothetical protein
MKRKSIFFVLLLAIAGATVIQSCEKKIDNPFVVHNIFTSPKLVGPEEGAVVTISGTTATLSWTSTSPDNDAIKADVYFGTTENPPLYKAGHDALSIDVPVEKGNKYFWSVTMRDANGIPTAGPEWNFIVLGAGLFTGDYNCDEPAEDYSYGVSFVKTNETTITTDNYWNSGWVANFTLNLTTLTYTMPVTTWGTWKAQESGTIDPATGTMEGSYTIWHNNVVAETGVHTYTK